MLDYVAGVWGYKVYKGCEQVHNRAIQYFLGVNRYVPLLAITGDVGWEPCELRWVVSMCRLWNRYLAMSDSRLCKTMLIWDMLIWDRPWAEHIHMLFQKTGFEELYFMLEKVDSDVIKDTVFSI